MEKIKIKTIIEVAGFPKEHVEGTMAKVVEKLKKEFEVEKNDVFEAVALKDKMEGFWSTFCEVNINFNKMEDLVIFCFEYMPSSVEIIQPEVLNLSNKDMENILNDLLSRLHHYDMLVKNLTASNEIMKKKTNVS